MATIQQRRVADLGMALTLTSATPARTGVKYNVRREAPLPTSAREGQPVATTRAPIKKREALLRGLSKRCPHCGDGPLFAKGADLHSHCSACRLKFQRSSGDPWVFLLFIDRAVIVFPIVAAIYFGLFNSGILVFLAFAASLIGFFVITTPNRYGFCVALDYLTRVYWGDPSDVLPEPGPVTERKVGEP